MLENSPVFTVNDAAEPRSGENRYTPNPIDRYYPEPSPDTRSDCSLMVTVIIRTKNRPQELQNAIDSVANQTYGNIELCVINDGGSDVESIVHAHAIGSITQINYVVLQPGRGRAGAANAGLEHARGDWLMFLDDDDSLDPPHIAELLLVARQQPQTPVIYSWVRGINPKGEQEFVWCTPYSASRMLWSNFIPIHAVLFQRSLLNEGLRFDTAFDIYEDWDFWTQVSRIAKFSCTNKITATYNLNGDSGTWNQQKKQAEGRLLYYTKWLALLSAKELNESFIEAHDFERKVSHFSQEINRLENERMQQVAEYSELMLKDKATVNALEEKISQLEREHARQLRKEKFDINTLEEQIYQLEIEHARLLRKEKSAINKLEEQIFQLEIQHTLQVRRDKSAVNTLEEKVNQLVAENVELTLKDNATINALEEKVNQLAAENAGLIQKNGIYVKFRGKTVT